MASERLTLTCGVDVEDDFPKKTELFWKECKWTRLSDDKDCRLQAEDNYNVKELQCDKAIGEANMTRSADNMHCSITFRPEEENPLEKWKCTLQKCMHLKLEEGMKLSEIKEGGCGFPIASDCIDNVIVNVTVRIREINLYSYSVIYYL